MRVAVFVRGHCTHDVTSCGLTCAWRSSCVGIARMASQLNVKYVAHAASLSGSEQRGWGTVDGKKFATRTTVCNDACVYPGEPLTPSCSKLLVYERTELEGERTAKITQHRSSTTRFNIELGGQGIAKLDRWYVHLGSVKYVCWRLLMLRTFFHQPSRCMVPCQHLY